MSQFGNLKIVLGLGQDLLMIRFKWEPLNRMVCKRFKCYRFNQIATSSLLIFRYEEGKYESRCSRQSTRQI